MTTCSDVITYALKLTKVLPSGTTPTSAETADGLIALQAMYDEWVTGGMFGRLEDIYLDTDDTAEEGKRYYVASGVTLTAPTSVYIDANGDTRQPRDMAIYESFDGTTRTVKLYDRTAWVAMTGLVSGDEAPLSKRDAMGLAACLATTGGFQAMFGGEISPGVIVKAAAFLKNVMGKDGSTQDDETGTYY